MKLKKTMAVLVLGLLAVQARADETMAPGTQREKESYTVGLDLARTLKRQGIELDAEAIIRGIRDGLSGAEPLMTEEEIRTTLTALQAEFKQRRARARTIPRGEAVPGAAAPGGTADPQPPVGR